MKKQVSMFLLLLVLSSCRDKSAQQTIVKQRQENNELIKRVAEKNGTIFHFKNQLLSIHDRIEAINRQEESLLWGSSESPMEKKSLEKDLDRLGQLLLSNKNEIASLRRDMLEQQNENNDLILHLQLLQENNDHQIDQLDKLLALLTERKIQINTLEQVNQRIEQQCLSLTEKTQKVHYLIGSKRELRSLGISKTGIWTVLGNPKMKADFDPEVFLVGKESALREIQIPSEKVRILSLHPSESYKIQESERGSILTIIDGAKFWSITKYLTILKT